MVKVSLLPAAKDTHTDTDGGPWDLMGTSHRKGLNLRNLE